MCECVCVCVSPSQDRDSPQIFRACRAFRNPLNFTTSFQECGNQGLRDMTCLKSHHSPEAEEEVFSETVLPAPQHQPLLLGGGHSLPTAQPFDAVNAVGVPSIGPHLRPGSMLCILHKLCHSTYSSPTSSKRGILIYISNKTGARYVLFPIAHARPIYVIEIDIFEYIL